jgi:EAL domain-containing protein (putative c-di-GMP-specific phosphodiesterase class I)
LLGLIGGKPIGCEALVRWRPHNADPAEIVQLQPAAFLELAEDSELIAQIGDWVLHAACAQAAAWHRDGLGLTVSVNVSARELTEADLAERVQEALAYFQLPAHALCLDVSEEVVLRDPARARTALKDVQRLGVAVALDNFGAGQSSLSLPGSLPLSMLKLDRTLIQGFERHKDRRAVVVAMLALAQEVGLSTVAVGIETNSQLALARALSCSMGQGFLLHRPDAPERLRLREPLGTIRSPAPWRPIVRLRGASRHN